MSGTNRILIATVCLERNRWGNRQPSFAVSEWLPRFVAEGFDGIELWAPHYRAAAGAEQARLEQAAPLAIYNSYVGFDDADAAARADEAAAITRLRAAAVKYNVGNDREFLPVYQANVLEWAEQLPSDCRLLCECHPGTALEQPEVAAPFMRALPPERFGAIVHVRGGEAEALARWFELLGERVQHLHVQFRGDDSDPSCADHRAALDPNLAVLREHRFAGTLTVEFTRGIGPDEDIEVVYANACADLRYLSAGLA